MITYQRVPIKQNNEFFVKRRITKDSKINVKVGEIVNPESIVAYGWRNSGYRTFNLAKLFQLSEEKCGDLLQRTIGSRVYVGDILAVSKQWLGLREKVFRSPVNGIIVDYNSRDAKITIQYLPTEIKITSGVFGRVTDIKTDSKIVIGTSADTINTVVGFGTYREGSLLEVGYPDIPIQPDQLNAKHANKIIYGGTKISLDALYKALSVGVRGVITGGMEYVDFIRLIGSKGRLEDIGISLLLTEGFGTIGVYSKMYDYLRESQYRHAIIIPKYNTIVIPVSQENIVESDLPQGKNASNKGLLKQENKYGVINEGITVRILTERMFGAYGIVEKLDKNSAEISVNLGDQRIIVPAGDVEIIK